MKEESIERIEAIKEEIHQLNVEIFTKRREIEKIYLVENTNFKDSYIEYFDGENYIFMKVERENIREEDMRVELDGPAVVLDDNPLYDPETWDDEIEDTEITDAFYDSWFHVKVLPDTLAGHTFATIKKISKEQFFEVLDSWMDTMKKKMS